jgi:hypothetical protein
MAAKRSKSRGIDRQGLDASLQRPDAPAVARTPEQYIRGIVSGCDGDPLVTKAAESLRQAIKAGDLMGIVYAATGLGQASNTWFLDTMYRQLGVFRRMGGELNRTGKLSSTNAARSKRRRQDVADAVATLSEEERKDPIAAIAKRLGCCERTVRRNL